MEKNQTYALRAIEIEKQRLIDNVKSHLEKNNRIELLDQINEAFEKYPSLSEQYCYYVVSCVYGSIDPCSADKFMGTLGDRTKKISSRVTSSIHKYFNSFSLKMSRSVSSLLLESFPILYKTTVDTIKTIFDSDEFEAIFDYIKVNFVKINSSSSVFQHVIYDDLQLNIICKDNIADKYGFLEKLKSLHFFELFILELWIHTFWYHKDSTNDFEEYISKDYDFPKL